MLRPPSALGQASPCNKILARLFKGRLVTTVTLKEGCECGRVGRKLDIR